MKFLNYIQLKSQLIEQQLDKLIPKKEVPHKELFNASRYSLLGGGKRLRPILALATTEALGGNVDHTLVPACALEMIHTYSLIHDDLPCMDDDDFRRGKPSLHKAYPEGHAVLTGDFLLTHAFYILATDPNLTAEQKVKLIALASCSSGGEGMIAGQILDLESEGKNIDIERLKLIHSKKTGALITASIEFGGIVAGATDFQMDILSQFGQKIGLAFQIIDDILDVTASEEKHGKLVASDVTNDKATYVSFLGIEESKNLAQSLFHSSMQTLNRLSCDVSLLAGLAELIVNRKK